MPHVSDRPKITKAQSEQVLSGIMMRHGREILAKKKNVIAKPLFVFHFEMKRYEQEVDH